MNTGRPMEHDLLFDFLRVVEAAAVEAARTMGRGDRKYSDHVAVEKMREVMDTIPMDGTIVIGEGERDEAPMLYIGERVGMGAKNGNPNDYPEVDIAVDPLEGAVDIDAPVKENLNAIAARLRRKVEDLTVIVLDRPRHSKLIQDIRDAGARIRLITDGDLSAGISAAVAGSGVHALMGIGGGPEGVITAAAMKCLNGEIQSRFVLKEQLEQAEDRAKIPDGLVERMREMGISDPSRVYHTNDLAPGDKIIFAACGVTDGAILHGVRFFGTGKRTQSLVMTTETMHVRFVDTVHVEGGPDAFVRFDRM